MPTVLEELRRNDFCWSIYVTQTILLEIPFASNSISNTSNASDGVATGSIYSINDVTVDASNGVTTEYICAGDDASDDVTTGSVYSIDDFIKTKKSFQQILGRSTRIFT